MKQLTATRLPAPVYTFSSRPFASTVNNSIQLYLLFNSVTHSSIAKKKHWGLESDATESGFWHITDTTLPVLAKQTDVTAVYTDLRRQRSQPVPSVSPPGPGLTQCFCQTTSTAGGDALHGPGADWYYGVCFHCREPSLLHKVPVNQQHVWNMISWNKCGPNHIKASPVFFLKNCATYKNTKWERKVWAQVCSQPAESDCKWWNGRMLPEVMEPDWTLMSKQIWCLSMQHRKHWGNNHRTLNTALIGLLQLLFTSHDPQATNQTWHIPRT